MPAIELAGSRFAEKRALEVEVATLSERLETRTIVDRAKGLRAEYGGRTFVFCSEHCLQRFQADPERYAGGRGASHERSAFRVR